MYSVNDCVDPMSPISRDALASAVSFVPLKSLRHGFLEDLFLHVQPQLVRAGDVVFELGTYDQQVIFLSSGSLKLEYESGYEQVIRASDNLLPIANEQPRPAKCTALEDGIILRIDADTLDKTLSWSQITDYMLSELAFDRANDGSLDVYQSILRSNLFFKVPSVNAEQIFSRLQKIEVKQGDIVIEQGDVGDCCYFLLKGSANIYKEIDGERKHVAEIFEGRCFGEDALVDQASRNATVIMNSDGTLMRLDQADFARLFKEPEVEELDFEELDQRSDRPILIDIRTDSEYRLGHLALSANIPMSLLSMKRRVLSLSEAYVLYCDTGRRSSAAAFFLGKAGYNVVSIKGGLQGQRLFSRLVSKPSYILRDGILERADDD